MNTHRLFIGSGVSPVVLVLVSVALALPGRTETQAFTYQGQLTDSGGPVSGSCDFAFRLWDGQDPDNSHQVGPTVTKNLAVENGLFTATLDFGPGVFDSDPRWLGVEVDCGSGPASLPRQRITTAPVAGFSLRTRGIEVDSAGNVSVAADLGVGDDVNVNGAVSAGSVDVAGPGHFDGVLSAHELFTSSNASIDGNASIAGNASIDGGASIGGLLNAGNGEFGNELRTNDLIVDDAASLERTFIGDTLDIFPGTRFEDPDSTATTLTTPGEDGTLAIHSGRVEFRGGLNTKPLRVLPAQRFFFGFDSYATTLDIPGVNGTLGVWDQLEVRPGTRNGIEVFANNANAVRIFNESPDFPTLWAENEGGGPAGFFVGQLSSTAKLFTIDHPLEPEDKYLHHASVESDGLINLYRGRVTLDEDGTATVELPEWFEPLNGDPEYQLTAIGEPMPWLHIADEVENGRFRIAGGVAGGEVSWSLTGRRRDAWARAHPFQAVTEKKPEEKGLFLHPEEHGAAATQRISSAWADDRKRGAGATADPDDGQ